MAEAIDTGSGCNEAANYIMRPALYSGSMGFLGELYDARKEKFTSIRFFSVTPPINVLTFDSGRIEYSEGDRLSDKFRLLKVEGGIKLSAALGIATLQGHGKYLSKKKKSEKTICLSCLYNFKTCHEKLIIDFNSIDEYKINKDAFDDDRFTHIVTEIIWGANNTITLEHRDCIKEKKTEVQGFLEGKLSDLEYSISAGGSAEYNTSKSANTFDFKVKINADILPAGKLPTNLEKTKEYIQKLPELVKELNDKKGVPLYYVMQPISIYKKFSNSQKTIVAMIKTIDESFTTQLVSFLEDVAEKRRLLNDFKTEFEKYEKYLPENYLNKTHKMIQEIKSNEKLVKVDLTKKLCRFKEDKTDMEDLVGSLKEHQLINLNLTEITKFIEGCKKEEDKITDILHYLSKNINYFGRNDNLTSLMIRSVNSDYLVLFTSKELTKKNPVLSSKSLMFFLSKAQNPKEKKNNIFVIVDFDVNSDTTCEVDEVRIFHYKNGEVVSRDVYKDSEPERSMNFAQVTERSNMTFCTRKPEKRTVLKLPCPGETCPKDSLVWNCSTCKQEVEYGFDDYFHCSCGKARSSSYELKCSSLKHGDQYLPVNKNFLLDEELNKLKPLKEINILLLGESGVGKSFWINSVANYFQYETLERAKKEKLISVMPFYFEETYYDDTNIKKIEIGEKHDESSTKEPKAYDFIHNNNIVRFIDTPSLDDLDSSGETVYFDKKYMKIFDRFSHLKEIHGICVLLPANRVKIDIKCRFFITKLLTCLHKSAAKNILFCFMNSQSSYFTPGETQGQLETVLYELKLENMIQLNKNTIFCFDNIAFKFLNLLKCNVPSDNHMEELCSFSWEKSFSETKRLIEQVKKLTPHKIAETRFLIQLGNQIFNLSLMIVQNDEFETEEKVITQTVEQFLTFLKENAIMPYNYALSDYLRAKSIYRNRMSPKSNLYERYGEEKNFFMRLMENAKEGIIFKQEYIAELEKKLFDLKLSGPKILQKTKIRLADLID